MRVYYQASNKNYFNSIKGNTYHECTKCESVMKPNDKVLKTIDTWQISVCKFCENEDFNIFKEVKSND